MQALYLLAQLCFEISELTPAKVFTLRLYNETVKDKIRQLLTPDILKSLFAVQGNVVDMEDLLQRLIIA